MWDLVTGGKGNCEKPAAGSIGLLFVSLAVMVVVVEMKLSYEAGAMGCYTAAMTPWLVCES